MKKITPQHLTTFRKHFKLSQAQMAKELGITRCTLSRWEKNHTPIPSYMFFALRGMGQYLKEREKQK